MNELPRPSTEHQRLALKSATRGAVKLAGGGDAFALVTRIEAPALSKAGAAQDPHFLALDVALDADLEAGAPVITAALAAALGFRLVAKNDAARTVDAEALTLGGIGRLTKELGDVGPAVLAALADGQMCAAERSNVLKEIDQALAAADGAAQRGGYRGHGASMNVQDAPCPTCGHALPVDDTLRFDAVPGVVVRGGMFAQLTKKEAEIFECLLAASPKHKTKEQVMADLYWRDNDEPFDKIIDVWICKLRKKVGGLGISIETIWGQGFRLMVKAVPDDA